MVVLERPHHAHRVGRLPEDVGLPGHRHVQGTARRFVSRRDRVDLAVVFVREFLPLRRGELLDVWRVEVVSVLDGALVDDALEAGDLPAAADGAQLRSDHRLDRVHGRRRDLDDDGGDEVILRLGVVVGEDELALGAVDRAGRLVDSVARREHVRRHGVVVDTPDDVRSRSARSARVRHRVARRDDRRVAEKADEAPREVDGGARPSRPRRYRRFQPAIRP